MNINKWINEWWKEHKMLLETPLELSFCIKWILFCPRSTSDSVFLSNLRLESYVVPKYLCIWVFFGFALLVISFYLLFLKSVVNSFVFVSLRSRKFSSHHLIKRFKAVPWSDCWSWRRDSGSVIREFNQITALLWSSAAVCEHDKK